MSLVTQVKPKLVQHAVAFSQTGLLPPLVRAYLEEEISVKPLYATPFHIQGILDSIQSRKFPVAYRKTLVAVLRRQYHSIPAASRERVDDHLALLEQENTFTVTTGHQLNLFTGPLYLIYKLASTVHLARQLKQAQPENHFIPVYWMASEDHDFLEINHANVYGRKVEWKGGQGGAAGRMICRDFDLLISEIEEVLDKTPEASFILEQFRMSYAEGHTLAEAMRKLVHGLFGKYGMVILDPDVPELKKEFANVMTDDALNSTAYTLVSNTISTLEPGFKVQVHPREINLFYLDTNFRGRIERKGDAWEVLGLDKQFTQEQLRQEISDAPDRFSPNVVLRPLFQESVLPNLAVVGGPAEISYWLEYKSMFDHYRVSFPCLVLRGMALVIDATSASRMEKLGIAREELFKSSDVLVKEFIARNSDTGFFETMRRQVSELFDSLSGKIGAIDPTLKASAEGEKQKSIKAVSQLEEKAIKALKRKHDTAVGQVEKLKSALFPGGVMQERVDSFLPFYARHGQDFIDFLVENMDPMAKKFWVFGEE